MYRAHRFAALPKLRRPAARPLDRPDCKLPEPDGRLRAPSELGQPDFKNESQQARRGLVFLRRSNQNFCRAYCSFPLAQRETEANELE